MKMVEYVFNYPNLVIWTVVIDLICLQCGYFYGYQSVLRHWTEGCCCLKLRPKCHIWSLIFFWPSANYSI